MGSELTTNGDALRLFFTDDIYLIKGEEGFSTGEVLGADLQKVRVQIAAEPIVAADLENPVSGRATGTVAAVTPIFAPEVTPVINPAITSVPAAAPAVVPVAVASIPLTAPVDPSATIPITIPQFPALERPAALSFKFLGQNKKKILILVNDADHEVSDEAGRELLRKIVKSINLTASDFALLNYAKYPKTSFIDLQQHFSSVLVFAFGVSAEDLQLPSHPENKIVMEGDVRVIFSGELRKLEQDPGGKKTLWGSLKQLGL
ncbi:hypothetical protein AQ505_24000 [Pedobacter sp. PACM 27299]|uniref:hypothetical protein n=1 Tax=Pedobacter sp. PACM 27299 TaxID=1727164 RepID=UPI000706B09F|nr:hypothetical protein [Pedobacter sp. PACM 27299]ALL08269.1 hypothetical protein AQ505_24000 [Pedobacter sp. PACM 27299]